MICLINLFVLLSLLSHDCPVSPVNVGDAASSVARGLHHLHALLPEHDLAALLDQVISLAPALLTQH